MADGSSTYESRNHRAVRVFSFDTARPIEVASRHFECEVVMTRLALAFALFVTSVSFAMAQGTPQERQACTRDAQHFCRKDLGNDGAVQGCLQTNRAKLSVGCRKVFESHGM
jgi:hypothetical protein